MAESIQIKCRKCRTVLTKVATSDLLDAHADKFTPNSSYIDSSCPTVAGRTEIFLNEDALDTWIQEEIEKSEWTKGKLKCLKCASNVGSFDFVACQKCDCKQFNQPSVHFIQSKVDVERTT